jgi:hypothetical protein
VLNQISASGLSRICRPSVYRVGKDVTDPAAILVRSADMHAMSIPPACAPSAAPVPAPTTSPCRR